MGRIAQAAGGAFPKRHVYGGAARSKVVDGSIGHPARIARRPIRRSSRNSAYKSPAAASPSCDSSACFPWPPGCLVGVVTGSYYDAELSLFRKLWHFLKPRDVLLADRHFSDYGTLAALWNWGVDAVMRMNQQRPRDFRQGQYLAAPATGSSLGKNLPNAPAP